MNQATLALIVSSFSAFFTLGGLVWQFLLYRLSGARIQVELRPAKYDSLGSIIAGPPEGWNKTRAAPPDFYLDEWFLDIAAVRIVNIGRTAISVSDISLDIGKSKRGRHTRRGYPLDIHEGFMEKVARLEPGEEITVYYNLWAVIGDSSTREKPLKVRASATPAGRKAKRSKGGWLIDPDWDVLDQRDLEKVTPKLMAYRALFQSLHRRENLSLINVAWSSLIFRDSDDWTYEEVKSSLQEVLGVGASITAFNVSKAYNSIANGKEKTASSTESEHLSSEIEVVELSESGKEKMRESEIKEIEKDS